MNDLMTHPFQVSLKRPQMRSYPQLLGLFLVMKVTGLMTLSNSKKPFLEVDPNQEAKLLEMSPQARYAALLEAWLVRGDSSILGWKSRSVYEPWAEMLRAFDYIPHGKYVGDLPTAKAMTEAAETISAFYGPHTLGLLQLFGFVDLRLKRPAKNGPWRAKYIQATPLGKSFQNMLNDLFKIDPMFEPEIDPEGFWSVMSNLFPEWQEPLNPPEPEPRTGVHVFKVSYGNSWRRIALPAEKTFDELAMTILSVFDYDHEHNYAFQLQAPTGHRFEIGDPDEFDGCGEESPQLGSLGLRDGTQFTFLFDFGANHEFEVIFEGIEKTKSDDPNPRLLDGKGTPPQQYNDWDDSDW